MKVQILNCADAERHYTVAIGSEAFGSKSEVVQNVRLFPIGSQFINTSARTLMVRIGNARKAADWSCVGGKGIYHLLGSSNLSDPTSAKWGADAILTGLKEAAVKIPVSSSTWDKIHIKQVNNALAKAFPNGITDILSGNVKEQDYAYSAVSSDIAAGKLNLDCLVLNGEPIHIEAQCYNGTTKVGDLVVIDVVAEY